MVYAAAFLVGVLMCAVLAMSGRILLRDTVDADRLVQALFTLGIGASSTVVVIFAFPESALAIATAYTAGSAATLIALVIGGLVHGRKPEPETAPIRPDSMLRDPSSTLH